MSTSQTAPQSLAALSSVTMGTQPEPSLLPGVNILIEGPTGTGKTHSIGTLVDTGLDTFYLAVGDPGLESLIGYWTDKGKEVPSNLHWHNLKSPDQGLDVLIKKSQNIASMPQDSLYKLQDFERAQNNRFKDVLGQLANFEDQRTGSKFGSVHKWGPDKALVIDGLTGLSDFVMDLVIGVKPVRSQADWGIAQDTLYGLLKKLTEGYPFHFVLLSHVERETDEIVGGTKITVSTLGKKLPPKIPPMFSDVILAVRTNAVWTWSTANPMADLKTRNLKVADNITPSFASIIEKWKSRGGRFSSTVK
jgi:hypothetical protein